MRARTCENGRTARPPSLAAVGLRSTALGRSPARRRAGRAARRRHPAPDSANCRGGRARRRCASSTRCAAPTACARCARTANGSPVAAQPGQRRWCAATTSPTCAQRADAALAGRRDALSRARGRASPSARTSPGAPASIATPSTSSRMDAPRPPHRAIILTRRLPRRRRRGRRRPLPSVLRAGSSAAPRTRWSSASAIRRAPPSRRASTALAHRAP